MGISRFCLWAFIGCASFAAPLMAADTKPVSPATVHAVAIVNDQVISSTDLRDRTQLSIFAAGLEDTPETRQKLAPQVLHILIDETLQLQEGAKNSITVTEGDIQKAEAFVEQRSGHEPGSMEKELEARHIPKLTFYAQLRAQLTWTKLLQKKVRPKVHITEEDLDRASKKAAATPSSNQVQISVLRLPVDAQTADAPVHALADKLAGEIHGGASFDAVAQQFSSGGGEAISQLWVDESQIDPAIAKALTQIKPGEITPPVKTQNGYQIVRLEGRRGAQQADATGLVPEAELAIRQITLTLKPDAKPQEASLTLGIARDVAKHAGTCFDKNLAGVENLSDMDIKVTYARQLLSKLTPELRRVVEALQVGDISEPVASPQGIELYMICERIDMPSVQPAPDEAEKEQLRQSLYSDKIELESQKYMRSLRRDAFIDVRL